MTGAVRIVVVGIVSAMLGLAGCGGGGGGSGSSSESVSILPAIATAVGTVKKQGMTTYMYGTHVLVNDSGSTLYALKSDSILLDQFIDRKVTVKGRLVDGYPLGGPDFIEVTEILPP